MKANIRHLILILCAAVMVAAFTTGCRNTAQGAGKDIENAGEKIQEKTK
jgi:predicted small secreted protein